MEDFKGSPALDAGLLAGAQAVEHYEISRYGILISWAKQMHISEAGASIRDARAGNQNRRDAYKDREESGECRGVYQIAYFKSLHGVPRSHAGPAP